MRGDGMPLPMPARCEECAWAETEGKRWACAALSPESVSHCDEEFLPADDPDVEDLVAAVTDIRLRQIRSH